MRPSAHAHVHGSAPLCEFRQFEQRRRKSSDQRDLLSTTHSRIIRVRSHNEKVWPALRRYLRELTLFDRCDPEQKLLISASPYRHREGSVTARRRTSESSEQMESLAGDPEAYLRQSQICCSDLPSCALTARYRPRVRTCLDHDASQ